MARHSKRPKSHRSNPAAASISDATTFRRLIHEKGDLIGGLSKNRRVIAPKAIETIVKALMPNPIYRNVLAPDAFPRTYSRVKAGPVLAHLDAEFEIVWTASILSHFTEELNDYLNLKDAYSKKFLNSEFLPATKILDEIENKYGISLWSTNARLTLAHVANGIATQKDLLKTIVNTPGIDTLYAYLSFFFSYSLEESVTLNEIRREFAEPSILRSYFLYHVSPFDLDSVDQPHRCISLENNSPIIDRFETLVEMLLLFHSRNHCLSATSQATNLLNAVKDPRLYSLDFCLSSENVHASEHSEFLAACDEYTLGNYATAAATISSILSSNPAAAWVYELAARNDVAFGTQRSASSLMNAIIADVRAFLDLSKDLPTVRTTLRKAGFQTRKLLPARAVAALLDRGVDIPISEVASSAQSVFCLSSPLVQPLNYGLLKRINVNAFDKLRSRSIASPAHKLNILSLSGEHVSVKQMEELSVPPKRALLYLAYHAYNMHDYSAATKYYEQYREDMSTPTSPRTLTFQYALHRRQQRVDAALNAFVDAYFDNQRLHALYSMDEFAEWSVSRAAADASALNRSILLHVYSSLYDARFDGDLSDALEDVLDHFGARVPSALLSGALERRRLNYFVRFVATIDRLEDTTRFDSLDEIETERITLLQWLVQNDASNRNAYTQEISSITKDQEVARLSAQFERSKIYVHEEGIRRTFETEIKPKFLRYRQMLSEPGVGAQIDQIEQRIRKLLKESELTVGYLLIPSTERDSVYFSMIQGAYDIFGLDPNHGFKTYLSTRILHGILEGELRSSFMNEGLLVSVDSPDKGQEVLDRWIDQLARFEEGDRFEIITDIVKFSERITKAISELKDRRIRIYSKDLPEGLFKIAMSEGAFDRLKRSVTSTTTYEEFFERLFLSFWESIEACLRDVKLELTGRFRKDILGAFDALEASLTSPKLDRRPTELLDALARCRPAFSIDLERVSSWFARAGVLSREPFLAATAIRVAATITNNCYPQHPLDIRTSESGIYEIAGELLNPLVDLLTNCFQNAAEHSGVLQRAPNVNVKIVQDSDGALSFAVTSELSETVNVEACRAGVQELVNEVDAANPGAVTGEGRTGIRKIKRIVRHDFESEEKICVDVSSDRAFIVRFRVPRRYVNERSYH